MSFYGSIYYQIVDALYKVLINNAGAESIDFPLEGSIPDNDIIYRASGRQGILSIHTGNKWISFTKNLAKDDNGEPIVDENGEYVQDSESPYIIWHGQPDVENCDPIVGFKRIDTMFEVIPRYEIKKNEQTNTAEVTILENFNDAANRLIPIEYRVEGCRMMYISKMEQTQQGVQNVEHEIYVLVKKENTDTLQWQLEKDSQVVELTPGDFFLATNNATVDKAGHVAAESPVYYKMPKSDVTEQIELLWKAVEGCQEDISDLQELTDKHEEYIGDWSSYRGFVTISLDEEGNPTYSHWCPTLSSAIGDMNELITGVAGGSLGMDYSMNKDVSIVKVIGNMSDLYEEMGKVEGFGLTTNSLLTDANLVRVILYLKSDLTARADTLESTLDVTNIAVTGLKDRLVVVENALPDITEALGKETEERKAADTDLDTAIKKVDSDLIAYKSEASAAHTALEGNINAHIQSVNSRFDTTDNLISTTREALEGQISTVQTNLNTTITEEVKTLNSTIATNKSAAEQANTELAKTVGDNKTEVDNFKSDYNTRMGQAESNITNLQAKDITLEASIKANKELIDALSPSVTASANAIIRIDEEIDALPTTAIVDQKIANAAYDDSDLQSRVGTLETANYLTADSDIITGLFQEIADLKARLEALEPSPEPEPEPDPTPDDPGEEPTT